MKTIAVIGLGQFGYQIAINLSQKGFDVLAIDQDADVATEIKDLVQKVVILDATDETAMRAVNVDTVDEAVVAIGSNVQSSLLVTALLQRMNINKIYVRAIEPLQESILRSMGITEIINIEKEMGSQLANTLSNDAGKYIELSDRHSLMEIKVPKNIIGKNLKSLQLRSNFKINIVGIKTSVPIINDDGDVSYTTKMMDVPDPDYLFKQNDLLVISGTDEQLFKFIRIGNASD